MRAVVAWAGLGLALGAPVWAAAQSPLLAWRDAVYIGAGFAGIVAMGLVLVQLVLIGGPLPGMSMQRGRHLHRWVGALLVLAVLGHVAGLWLTSPPDVVDALLFRSPTPFSLWGVLAMWAVLGAALLAMVRKAMAPRLRVWRRAHRGLAGVIAGGTVLHVLLIEGTMEWVTKLMLCGCVLVAAVLVLGMPILRRRRQGW